MTVHKQKPDKKKCSHKKEKPNKRRTCAVASICGMMEENSTDAVLGTFVVIESDLAGETRVSQSLPRNAPSSISHEKIFVERRGREDFFVR